jgi:hypothetical protein
MFFIYNDYFSYVKNFLYSYGWRKGEMSLIPVAEGLITGTGRRIVDFGFKGSSISQAKTRCTINPQSAI